MARAHRGGLLLVAGAWACAPLPVDVSVATSPDNRPRIIGLARDGAAEQVAVIDPPDVPAEHLPTLPAVPDGAAVEIVVLTLTGTLNTLGLELGLFRPGDAAANDPQVVELLPSTARIERATVVDGEPSTFEIAPAAPTWLTRFQLPALQPCTQLAATPLPDVPRAALFVVGLGDGRALVGVRDSDAMPGVAPLHLVRRDLTVQPLELGRPADLMAEPLLYATGALPVGGTQRDVWLSMRFGELWRVTVPEEGQEGTAPMPSRRAPLGMRAGLSFLHGDADADGNVRLYGLDPQGPLVRFDGAQAVTLHTFPDVGDYFGGGITRDASGAVYAARNTAPELIRVVGDSVTPIPIADAREGLTSVLARGDGLLFSDGRGRIFRRSADGMISTLTDFDIGTGAQALIALDAGFLAAGGVGVIHEWRDNGGACPQLVPATAQTLRWWLPFEGGFLVTGPERDGSTSPAALTYFGAASAR